MPVLDINSLELNDINVDTITNESKTGIFDKLMVSVNDNIKQQYDENRINSNDFATVYLGSIQAVLTQSIQFALQEQVTELEISNAIKDNLLKDEQIKLASKDLALKDEQLKAAYTDRVLKDKQTAKLGLDNVMKKAEASRVDDNVVYTPVYIEAP